MLNHLSYVTVLVADQDEALDFYTETLNLVKQNDFEMPDDSRWLSVSTPGTEYPRLPLVAAETEHPRLPEDGVESRRERVGSQVSEYVTFVFSVDDCQEVTEKLCQRGVEIVSSPSETPWGIESSFRDPWGNIYEIVQPPS